MDSTRAHAQSEGKWVELRRVLLKPTRELELRVHAMSHTTLAFRTSPRGREGLAAGKHAHIMLHNSTDSQ